MIDSYEAVVEVAVDDVVTLIVELVLLLWGLASSTRVAGSSGASCVIVLGDESNVGTALVVRGEENTLSFVLGRNQAEYALVYLLRAFRDGAADVSHIHIEGQLDGGPFDLILLLDRFVEPMTADQAARLMNASAERSQK